MKLNDSCPCYWDIVERRAYEGGKVRDKNEYWVNTVKNCSVLLEDDEKFGINILNRDKIKSIKQPLF